ncbi:MAG: phytoene/squalene synthase family protein [Chloroflexi bacterium]|nr:phytoene/squalene synthase family protein [Chloroflexota bacterium]
MLDTFSAGSRTFAFAARFLPPPRRRAAAGLYAFARAVDDLVDAPPPAWSPEQVRACLMAWRAWLKQPTLSSAPDPGLARALLPALVIYQVPPRYLELLLDGVGSDLYRRDICSWPELRDYCVHVASSVGLAMCYVLGAGHEPRARQAAVELGIAMQLTNILRDVGADLADGRVYLPADELAAHGYSRDRLTLLGQRVLRGEPDAVDDAFRELMRRQIARAHAYYERGLDGVCHLPAECRPSILLAGRLYRAILAEIEAADYVVFGRRAATSTRRKILEAARCLLVPSPAPIGRRGAHGPAVAVLPKAHS